MDDTEEKVIDAEGAGDPEQAQPAAPPAQEAVKEPRARERRGRTARRVSARPPRARSEFDQRLIAIRRVARVMAGGRRFSFSAALIIGNRKGKVGVGLGKAGDTTQAIEKATRDAKKNLITVSLKEGGMIAHDVSAKFAASSVALMPAPGRGLVAGSSVRPVLELAGVSNTVAKIHSGSKNGLNNARAAIEALKKLKV